MSMVASDTVSEKQYAINSKADFHRHIPIDFTTALFFNNVMISAC